MERGFILDNLIQGLNRGSMRQGKKQDCLIFASGSIAQASELKEELSGHIRRIDTIKRFDYPLIIAAMARSKKDKKGKPRKTRSDKLPPGESQWKKDFKRAIKSQRLEFTEELLEQYMDAKRENPDAASPSKWLKGNRKEE